MGENNMLNFFGSIIAEHDMTVSLCLFFVGFTFAYCSYLTTRNIEEANRKYAVKIPVTGMTKRQAVQRAKALSKTRGGKVKYVACLHCSGLWFAQYEIIPLTKFEERKRLLCFDNSDSYEIIS
jgi:hypothetical protein